MADEAVVGDSAIMVLAYVLATVEVRPVLMRVVPTVMVTKGAWLLLAELA